MSLQQKPARQTVGRGFETYLGERVDLDDVAPNGGDDCLVDGYATRRLDPYWSGRALRDEFVYADEVPPGASVSAKVCRVRIADSGSTRRGRWMFFREEFVGPDSCDAVALGVYDEDEEIIDDAVTVLPVEEVLDVVDTWTDSPHERFEAVSRPSWASIFDPEVVDR